MPTPRANTPEWRSAYRRAENRVVVEFRNMHPNEWRAILHHELNRATEDNMPTSKPTGEYRMEVRGRTDIGDRDSVDGTAEWVYDPWRPNPDVDPIPDREDMATQTAVLKLRELTARANRGVGWYAYRTVYADHINTVMDSYGTSNDIVGSIGD